MFLKPIGIIVILLVCCAIIFGRVNRSFAAEKQNVTEPDAAIVKKLIREAIAMTKMSYAPYSHFNVGAALLADDGCIYTGANVENASYPAGCCAERTAIFYAASHGVRKINMIAICGGADGKITSYCSPCGVCRQVMREFCIPEEFLVILATSENDFKIFTLEELLPLSYGPENLKNVQ